MQKSPQIIRIVVLCALGAWASVISSSVCWAGGRAEQLQTSGAAAFQRGDFEGAAAQWSEAARFLQADSQSAQRVQVLANLGLAYQSLGQADQAVSTLEAALKLAQVSSDRAGLLLAKSALGGLYTIVRQPVLAESYLREALEMARQDGDKTAAALILNNLGNLLATQDQETQAAAAYEESAALARAAGNPSLAARGNLNQATLALHADHPEQAAPLVAAQFDALQGLPDSHEKAQLFLAAGSLLRSLAESNVAPADAANSANALLTRAALAGKTALQVAQALGDLRSQSQALGFAGALAEKQGQIDEALQQTRRARFLAQQVQAPYLSFQWEWRIGRLLKTQGHFDDALAAYRRAVATLETLCDCAGGLLPGGASASFRRSAAPLYYQMADLLLQRTDSMSGAQTIQRSLIEARDTVELLKSSELEEYFQDECVTAGLSKVQNVGQVLHHAAVVYYIPLPERTEILLGLPSGLKRFTVPVGSGAISARVRRLRVHLEKPSSEQYLPYAQELYQWLLAPLEATLQAEKIDTLVFVPDSSLRTIPFAALHDGKRFLIEKFSLALTPGLTLMDPRPLERSGAHILTAGLSESVQGFEALGGVIDELDHVGRIYPATELLNRDFMKGAMQTQIGDGQFSIVHIASHGEFSSNPQNTYLLTYDSKLSLNELENVIRPHQFEGKPVELLVLSACQTAAGDDRAALGLAGVAIKSGARSALASLWSVNDEATSELMSHFYSALKQNPALSKAAALQKAQVEVLQDKRFHHPAFWSPYLLIGNWL